MADTTTSGETSYQHAYEKVAKDEKQGDDIHEQQRATQLSPTDRIWRAAKIIVFLASVSAVWILIASMISNESVIVDDSGIVYDGPGSDGSCNDTALYYQDQLIDHFANDSSSNNKWTQKYFINDDYFRGPGYPIFYIMGGEDEASCLFYPFVTHTLARIFGGLTLEAEHRFYGSSQPVKNDMVGLLTPDQAMADFVRLLKVQLAEYGCSPDRKSSDYCPVVTIGGSYPGFLSAMMRLIYSDVVDIGYASSAPLPLYAQTVNPDAYFDLVTASAERASAGCPVAIKQTLTDIQAQLLADHDNTQMNKLAARMGICVDDNKLPKYIDNSALLSKEVMYTVAANFADFNMGNYPPSPQTDLAKACHVFQDDSTDAHGKMKGLWDIIIQANGFDNSTNCFDLHTQIPDGPHATVSSSDWTGAGNGKSGLSWDFQCCTDLIVQTSYGPNSMFPARNWTLTEITEHCQTRFGVDPTPTRMVDQWHFDDLSTATRLLFVNGLNDGWSAVSILEDPSSSSPDSDIIVYNITDGAHHSELNNYGPQSRDTDDVKQAYQVIVDALAVWLAQVKADAT